MWGGGGGEGGEGGEAVMCLNSQLFCFINLYL